MFDALQLDQYCPGTLRPEIVAAAYPAIVDSNVGGSAFYVDALKGTAIIANHVNMQPTMVIATGSDSNVGDLDHPFQTVQRGLDAAEGQPGAIVALRYGSLQQLLLPDCNLLVILIKELACMYHRIKCCC